LIQLTEYKIANAKFTDKIVFALVSDLHGDDPKEIIDVLRQVNPDIILAAGDIFEALDGNHDAKNEAGFELLRACSDIAPTFYAPGNHEVGGTLSWSPVWKFSYAKEKNFSEYSMQRLKETGVYFLDDSFTTYNGMAFAGLGSALINKDKRPKLEFLAEFCALDMPKILICHHPEYYEKYLADMDIDLIVSGHAHGGQWRFFGRGIFAPGQGFFPKYTSGVYNGKLVVSRGLKKSKKIPRIFNKPEVVKIVMQKPEKI